MEIKFEDYKLIRNFVIDMLYDRSEQPLSRFFFERGSLHLFKMIPEFALRDIYDQGVSSKTTNILDMELRNDDQRVIIHFFKNSTKIDENIKKVKDFYSLQSNDHLICIICTLNKPSEQSMSTNIKNTEIFWYKSLTYNITLHSLVPKHQLIELYKKDELKKIFYLNSIESLPTILTKDPVAKYYNMRHGDICKITRNVSNVGESISYRFVSDKE
jgi:DNA-directed RNA polymerase I, II, and III subunit RPABC1